MPRDLAALAGLGALGYMLANRKKNSDVDTSGVSDVDLTGGARSMTPDTGELRDETGALSKLRRNTETGDLYSPNEPITRPSAASVASVQKAVRTPTSDIRTAEYRVKNKADSDAIKNAVTGVNSGAMDTQGFEDIPLSKPAKKEYYRDLSGKMQSKKSQADRDAEMAARRESVMSGLRGIGSSIGNIASKAQQNYESTRPVSRQVQRERDQAMARGNLKTGGKVVKMAKGGMTASSRGDGIAQRGKTRGTMVMCGGGYMKGKK